MGQLPNGEYDVYRVSGYNKEGTEVLYQVAVPQKQGKQDKTPQYVYVEFPMDWQKITVKKTGQPFDFEVSLKKTVEKAVMDVLKQKFDTTGWVPRDRGDPNQNPIFLYRYRVGPEKKEMKGTAKH